MNKVSKLLTAALLCPLLGMAGQAPDDFDDFMKDSMKEFNTFISDANKEFIDFMRHPWKKYNGEEPKKKRVQPEPPQMPVFNPSAPESKEPPKQLTIKEILDLTKKEGQQQGTAVANGGVEAAPETPVEVPAPAPAPKPEPKPTLAPATPVKTPAPAPAPKPEPAPKVQAVKAKSTPLYVGGEGRTKIPFMGVDYYVSNGLDRAITLSRLDENSVANALETLYKSDYKPLMEDLRTLRRDDLCNDWALYLFVKEVADKFGGKNESAVMRQFLLNNLGYRARMAKIPQKNSLALLIAPDSQLYGCPFITDGGARFYDVDADGTYSYMMCSKEAPSAKKKLVMAMKLMPRSGKERTGSTHTGKRYKATATASVPNGLMEFFKKTPQFDYNVYATARVDSVFSLQLLNALRPAIEGKSERDAANILLDFVQSGFEYATDPEQFGYEKPFFAEELFYYPYCDCEDRSILYRYLVKNLLGLDVILLDYPNHIATAVKFKENVPGDYVVCNGGKYVICDPTFIGAPVGMAMPQFKNVAAELLIYN